jgi:predicted ATP-grasp superfamily ATP-dependent carboligase
MAGILVTGGDERAALAVVRSLGRAGHRVVVGSRTGRSLAGASRYAFRDVALGDPLEAPETFVDRVRVQVRRMVADVVIPVTEPDLLAVLPRKDDLKPAVVPFPDPPIFHAACDKAHVAELAERVGLSVPRQTVVTRDGVSDLPPDAPEPTVLKPGRSVRSGAKLSVTYVDAGEPLNERVARLPDEAFPLLVQQRVVGPGVGVFMLRWDGRIVAAMAHRRIREKPPSGGVSVLRETLLLDPGIRRMAAELLAALEWSGVAMVELKIEEKTGLPFIMEVNGRFWGSLQLAVDAGVDFPALLVEAALGRRPPAVESYRVGVRSRWILGDLDHLLARVRRTPEELHLPRETPGRTEAIASFLGAFAPPVRAEVFRWTDPGPFLRETGRWIGALGGGRV